MHELDALMFQKVYENTPVGLVIVNKDTTIRSVNNYMFRTFKLTSFSVEGKRFGNLFNCAATKDPGSVCGENEQCKNCGLRQGVTAVLIDGVTIPETVLEHVFVIEGNETKKWFIISGSRIVWGDNVLAVVSFSDITTQKEYEALLNNQLSLDMATGITNKYALLNALKSLAVAKQGLAIALIDFDDFKSINDTYGHVAGDTVLNIFCACASASTRRQDILGRFGGEEFMIIFPGASSGLMIKAVQRIAAHMKERCLFELGIPVTFSAGVTEINSDNDMDVGAIIAEADANLYEAKKRGKNQIVVDRISVLID